MQQCLPQVEHAFSAFFCRVEGSSGSLLSLKGEMCLGLLICQLQQPPHPNLRPAPEPSLDMLLPSHMLRTSGFIQWHRLPAEQGYGKI